MQIVEVVVAAKGESLDGEMIDGMQLVMARVAPGNDPDNPAYVRWPVMQKAIFESTGCSTANGQFFNGMKHEIDDSLPDDAVAMQRIKGGVTVTLRNLAVA